MNTTTTFTTSTTTAKPAAAASTKFKAFALWGAISFPIIYVLCDFFNWPLFTFHPATNRVELFWAPARSGQGPTMYWYGWTATTLIAAAVVGLLGTLLPENVTRKVPLALVWLLPLLAVPLLVYSLMPFWTK